VGKSKAKLDRAAFERQIEGKADAYRNELRVEQLTPVFGCRRTAFLPVRVGHEPEVSALLAELPSPLAGFFHQLPGDAFTEWRDNLGVVAVRPAGDRSFVRLGHDGDRIYAGYENIYRTICRLARHVEDCRFIIKEDYSSWVDEYRIRSGELAFERGRARNEFVTDLQDYLESEAKRRSTDRDLVTFVARFLAESSAYHLDRAEHPSHEPSERDKARDQARALLDRCVRLDENEPIVLAQMGRLLRVEGRPAQAKRWFERHVARTGDAKLLFAIALASLEQGERQQARAEFERLAEAHPTHWAARLVLVAMCDQDGDLEQARAHAQQAFELSLGESVRVFAEQREQLHRNRLHQIVIDAFMRHVQLQTDSQRGAVAEGLLAWAELFRIKMCHDVDKQESMELAERTYAMALELEPSNAQIYCARALFLRQAGREGEREQLEAALAVDPQNIDALAGLGGKAFEEQRWTDAIVLLGRAVERSLATKTGSYARGVHGNQLVQALVHEGNRLLGQGGTINYETADSHFERAGTIAATMGWELARWPTPLLRRSAAHTYLGRHERALAFAEQALELDSESVHAMSEIANCLNNLGRFDDALGACDLAADLDPDYWHVPYVRACILAKTSGKVDEIVRLLVRAIELDPVARARISDDPDLVRVRDDPRLRRR
jgi:tetratricopeptide (TPR) repeat protein